MTDYQMDDLLHLMQRLRDPLTGCPWDIKQTFASITAHSVEETYEVIDAIERQDWAHLEEELGDLLLQIIFYCQMGSEKGYFDFASVTDKLVAKLIRRHPHVFPDGTLGSQINPSDVSEEQVLANWERIKQQEKAEKKNPSTGLLEDIPNAMPPFLYAQKMQKKAAKVGFDFACWQEIKAKILEELQELEVEIQQGNRNYQQQEMGDLLFSCINLARWLKIDPEAALSGTNRRFKQRFQQVEQSVQQHAGWQACSAQQLEQYWQAAKAACANDD